MKSVTERRERAILMRGKMRLSSALKKKRQAKGLTPIILAT
jgi:hypothetical protein